MPAAAAKKISMEDAITADDQNWMAWLLQRNIALKAFLGGENLTLPPTGFGKIFVKHSV